MFMNYSVVHTSTHGNYRFIDCLTHPTTEQVAFSPAQTEDDSVLDAYTTGGTGGRGVLALRSGVSLLDVTSSVEVVDIDDKAHVSLVARWSGNTAGYVVILADVFVAIARADATRFLGLKKGAALDRNGRRVRITVRNVSATDVRVALQTLTESGWKTDLAVTDVNSPLAATPGSVGFGVFAGIGSPRRIARLAGWHATRFPRL